MHDIAELVGQLAVAYERLDARWRRDHDLTANEKLVILFLSSEGAISPTALSEVVGITTAGMSTLVDRLEHEGYLRRQKHPTDGRRVLVVPTKRSLQARVQLEAVGAELARSMSADPAELAVVGRFLEQAVETVLRHASG